MSLLAWSTELPLLAVLVVLGLLAVPYVFGPILIYFTQRISGNPQLEPVSLNDPIIPSAVTVYVFPRLEQLHVEGFETLGAYFLSVVSNVHSFVVLLANRGTMTRGYLAVTYAKVPGQSAQLQQKHIEYTTRFTDGSLVDTNNSEELGAFAPVETRHTVSLPWVKDVGRLYHIHQAVVDQVAAGKTKSWRDADPAVYFHEAMLEEMIVQLDTGYLFREPGDGDFRPTIKGAILMTYKNLWPITSLLKARRKRKGERLLQELGG